MNLIDFKVTLIGDKGVGKTSLINKFLQDRIIQTGPLVGSTRELILAESRVRFSISECSEPSELRLLEYPDIYLICFGLNDPATLLNTVGEWYPRVRGTGIPLILVGCKSDISGVQREQIRAVSSQVQATDYLETSSKFSDRSVYTMFESAYFLSSPQSSISPSYKRRSRSAIRDNSSSKIVPCLRNSLSKDSPLPKRDSSLFSSRSKTGSLSSVSVKSKSSTLSSTRSDSSMISISTKTPRIRRRGETCRDPEKGERMVTIRCERLTSEREYEQVEIEIPLSVYNNMQAQSNPLSNRNSAQRMSLVNRLRNLFI